MLKKLQNKDQGFTIIEVMIVLVIAAVILLIVFLAVPALQRNSRNTQKKNIAANLLSAVSEYTNNNGGTPPTAAIATEGGTGTTDAQKIMDLVKTNKVIDTFSINVNSGNPGTAGANLALIQPGATGAGTTAIVQIKGTCPATGAATATTGTTGSSSRNIAIWYTVETANSTQLVCVASGI